VTDSQKKLRLFPFTLTRRARDWLLTIPSRTIQTWEELELKFLEKYFPMSKYWDTKMEIQNFKQGDTESLYDAWEIFTLMLKRCPNYELSEKQYLQIFTEGLKHNIRMFLDASAGGSLKNKTDHEVKALIESMAQNEYRDDASDYAVGAVLGQRKNKFFHAVYYASKVLNENQVNYSTTEKELLAVIFALEKFRSYLISSKVIIFTDHVALKYLLTKGDS